LETLINSADTTLYRAPADISLLIQ